jgi:high-affinity K+ transport system ATPase subunit B
MPDTAERLQPDGAVETASVQRLRTGDVVLMRPGASVPADREVLEGHSAVSEAMITGEYQPGSNEADAKVIAGRRPVWALAGIAYDGVQTRFRYIDGVNGGEEVHCHA